MILLGIATGLAVLIGVAGAIATTIRTEREAWIALATLGALAALGVWAMVRANRRGRQRRQSVTDYLEAAGALITNQNPTERDASDLLTLRSAALDPIPEATTSEFETAYCRAVADAVADQEVTPEEMQRLAVLTKGLALPVDTVKRANLNGFMQGFSALVADHKLTPEEEEKLAALRAVFQVPDSAVQAQLAKADQLRRARHVGESPLVAIDTVAKLRKGEECYHTTPVREMKERVARTWVEDGERYTERELQDLRAGTLYVTSQRLLVVADGTTSIRMDAILNIAVAVQRDGEAVLNLTVDGRKTPYFFAFPEPYVTLAHVERVWRQT